MNAAEPARRRHRCSQCGSTSHAGRHCPEHSAAVAATDGRGGSCSRCGQLGHNCRSCPASGAVKRASVRCSVCRELGHNSRTCAHVAALARARQAQAAPRRAAADAAAGAAIVTSGQGCSTDVPPLRQPAGGALIQSPAAQAGAPEMHILWSLCNQHTADTNTSALSSSSAEVKAPAFRDTALGERHGRGYEPFARMRQEWPARSTCEPFSQQLAPLLPLKDDAMVSDAQMQAALAHLVADASRRRSVTMPAGAGEVDRAQLPWAPCSTSVQEQQACLEATTHTHVGVALHPSPLPLPQQQQQQQWAEQLLPEGQVLPSTLQAPEDRMSRHVHFAACTEPLDDQRVAVTDSAAHAPRMQQLHEPAAAPFVAMHSSCADCSAHHGSAAASAVGRGQKRLRRQDSFDVLVEMVTARGYDGNA